MKKIIAIYEAGKRMDEAERMKMFYREEMNTTEDNVLCAVYRGLYELWLKRFHKYSRIVNGGNVNEIKFT